MPPLRARDTDVHLLAQHYLAQIAAEEGKDFSRFSSDVLELFLTLPWRGNVRELINVLRHAVVLHDGESHPRHASARPGTDRQRPAPTRATALPTRLSG